MKLWELPIMDKLYIYIMYYHYHFFSGNAYTVFCLGHLQIPFHLIYYRKLNFLELLDNFSFCRKDSCLTVSSFFILLRAVCHNGDGHCVFMLLMMVLLSHLICVYETFYCCRVMLIFQVRSTDKLPGVLIDLSDCTVFIFLVSICITLVVLDNTIDYGVIKRVKK